MSRRLISTGSSFEKDFGYSRAVVDGDFVFVSGTTGYDYATMTMPDDVAEQARNIAKTIASVLEDAGASLADIVRLQTFVHQVRAYCEAGAQGDPPSEVYGAIRPAASIYVVSGLLKPEMKVEIEATARLRL